MADKNLIDLANQVQGVLPHGNGGVPTGGTTGQVLKKNSNADEDTGWGTSGSAPGGTGFVRVVAGVLEDPATVSLDTDGTLAANLDTKVPSQKAVKTYVDTNTGIGGSAAFFAWGGDGSDGSLTYDGSTTILGMAPVSSVYTLTRDILASSMTVNSGVEIKTNGFAIFCLGTLTVNGRIDNDGTIGNAGNSPGSSTGGGGGAAVNAAGSSTARYPRITGGVSTAGTAGGSGQTTAGTQAGAANTGFAATTAIDASGSAGSSGSAGGKGGTGASGAGGASRAGGTGGGAPTIATSIGRNVIAAMFAAFLNSSVLTTWSVYGGANSGHGGAPGGSGGGGDGTNAGGGGGGGGSEGGSASFVGIFAALIVVGASGVISSNGGTGGTGGNGRTQAAGNVGGGGGGAGGSGGRGGILWLVYHKLTNGGTIQAAGGNGGTGGAKGSPHGTGTDDAAAGANGPTGPAGVVIQLQC